MNISINHIDPTELRDFVIGSASQGDLGSGNLFKLLFQGRLLFDSSVGDRKNNAWHVWSGSHWTPVPHAVVRSAAMDVVAGLYDATAEGLAPALAALKLQVAELDADSPDANQLTMQICVLKQTIKELEGRAAALRTVRAADAMLDVAVGLEGLHTDGSKWDQNQWLFAVQNGVLDFSLGATELFHAGRAEDMIRTVAPVKYDPEATAPMFLTALDQMFHGQDGKDEVISFLRRYFGSSLTGQIHKLFPIFFGPGGNNGKTTLLELLRSVMGEHALPVRKELLMSSNQAKSSGSADPQMYRLMGKRLVWCDEAKAHEEIDIAVIKALTGGNSISTRQNYGNQVEFKPSHKLVMLTNERPRMSSSDDATWRRVAVVGFMNTFVAEPDPAKPSEFQRIEHLDEKLVREEASGVLNWLIQGCQEFLQAGTINVPNSISAATEQYRKDQNVIAQWIEDQGHLVGAQYKTGAKLAYQDYKDWAFDNGIRSPMPMKKFSDQMASNGHQKLRMNQGIVFLGIGLFDRTHETTVIGDDIRLAQVSAAMKRGAYSEAKAHADLMTDDTSRKLLLRTIEQDCAEVGNGQQTTMFGGVI